MKTKRLGESAMTMRMVLVGLVAALGVTVPTPTQCSQWWLSVRNVGSAALADWDHWTPRDTNDLQGIFQLPPEVAREQRTVEQARPEEHPAAVRGDLLILPGDWLQPRTAARSLHPLLTLIAAHHFRLPANDELSSRDNPVIWPDLPDSVFQTPPLAFEHLAVSGDLKGALAYDLDLMAVELGIEMPITSRTQLPSDRSLSPYRKGRTIPSSIHEEEKAGHPSLGRVPRGSVLRSQSRQVAALLPVLFQGTVRPLTFDASPHPVEGNPKNASLDLRSPSPRPGGSARTACEEGPGARAQQNGPASQRPDNPFNSGISSPQPSLGHEQMLGASAPALPTFDAPFSRIENLEAGLWAGLIQSANGASADERVAFSPAPVLADLSSQSENRLHKRPPPTIDELLEFAGADLLGATCAQPVPSDPDTTEDDGGSPTVGSVECLEPQESPELMPWSDALASDRRDSESVVRSEPLLKPAGAVSKPEMSSELKQALLLTKDALNAWFNLVRRGQPSAPPSDRTAVSKDGSGSSMARR
jgi:hypothetical protein